MERQMALQEGANRWIHSEQESQIRLCQNLSLHSPQKEKKTLWIDET